MTSFERIMSITGTVVDALGVSIIVLGMIHALILFLIRKNADKNSQFRRDIGSYILLGLEFLVGGDIIRTVVVAPTVDNVIVLGAIVFIRTFLSTSIELELEGRWPWNKAAAGERK